jgi:DNA-binding response OmpR family regulator
MSKHIMLFNDSKELLLLTEEILHHEGFEVFLDSYSTDEYARIEAVMPDLVILDCAVHSEARGWEIIEMLKLRKATSNIPVILCITYRKQMDEMRAHLSTKRVLILPKPYDINDLMLTIKQAFKVSSVMQDPNVETG